MQRVKEKHWIRIWGLGITVTVFAAAGAMSGSCVFDTRTNFCEQFDIRCGAGQECATDQAVCINIGGCGNHHTDKDEICDDGNTTDGDGCSADCTSDESCGNGIIDTVDSANPKESCDDGNTRALDGCSPDCHLESKVCGNLILEKETGEVCDDGNLNSDDGCSANCKSNEACGNGTIDNSGLGGILHEECDPNDSYPLSASDTMECDNDCTFPTCGDGHTNKMYLVTNRGSDHYEECDSDIDSPICDNDCTIPACGDGHTNSNFIPPGSLLSERCDKGIDNSDTLKDACRKNCQKASCGDGVEDTGEMCDDGDKDNTDDCPDGPGGTCQAARCGDGFPESGVEQCDDGPQNSNTAPDACRDNCKNPSCGDNVVDPGRGETCDRPDSLNATCSDVQVVCDKDCHLCQP